MRSSPRARAAFLLLYGALLGWQIDRWLLTPHGVVSTWTHRRDGRVVSTGSPAGVSQTFSMGADGLDGVWLRPHVAGGSPTGDLVVDLLDATGRAPIRVERVVLPALDVGRAASLHVPFRAIRQSRGRAYRLDVRHVHFGSGPAIDLAITRDDTLVGARLFADGREQWGDLLLETSARRATLPYWVHEVLRPWPAWVYAWPAVAGALLAFNGLLAWACACAVGMRGGPAPAPMRPTPAPIVDGAVVSSSATPAISLATMVVLLVAVAGTAMAGRPTGRYRALDLIAALPEARIRISWGTLHGAIAPESLLFPTGVHRGIVAMPPSTLAWTVEVPRDAVLRLGAAMRPDMWTRESDGIEMRVHIDHAGGRTTAAALTLFPMGVPAHRQRFPVEVPLTSWAGQRITIVLETTPERWGNAVNDVPVWTEPRIEWPRNPAAGTARIIQNAQ